MYKAVLLDVDGTLVSALQTRPGCRTLETIGQLQARGVLVLIVTGRSYFVANEDVLGFRADYTVCTNGAYAVDARGAHLFDERLRPDQLERIAALCDAAACPFGFCFSDANYAYRSFAWFEAAYRELVGGIAYVADGESRARHRTDLPYTAFARLPDPVVRELRAGNPDLVATAYAPEMYDIFRADVNKAQGVARLLDGLGLRPQELVAIGDGDNDIEMLALAGCGVAMANGSRRLLACADYVTGSVDEEGAASAMRQLFGLDGT